MKRIAKGDYGYLRYSRTKTIVITACMLAAALGIYFGAYAYWGTNQNLFTILAVLILLPTAKMAVSMIMFINACRTPCSEAAHAAIRPRVKGLVNGYELYMTSDKENYPISHVTIARGAVIALTESGKCNAGNAQNHIRRMMQSNGYHGYTVKVFTSLDHYVERLGALQSDAATEASGKDDEVLQLLKQISL